MSFNFEAFFLFLIVVLQWYVILRLMGISLSRAPERKNRNNSSDKRSEPAGPAITEQKLPVDPHTDPDLALLEEFEREYGI